MKLPFFSRPPQKDPAAMTEAELAEGIARCNRMLSREKDAHMALAQGTIIVGGGAAAVAAFGFGIFASPVLLGIIAVAGGGVFFGGGFTCKAVMSRALCRKHDLEDVFEAKVQARLEAEQISAVERQLRAAEQFNAAIDAGLPLEKSITVSRSPLRLKFPSPRDTQHGFSRIFGARDPRPGRG
ncbi:MAG: hypothetical protein ACAH83_07155 [Alphaproteobacteria bacterium]